MTQYWDIAVQDRYSQLILIVEVKVNRHFKINSHQWASKSYYNLRTNGVIPPAPYFSFAFLDYFYLWNNNKLNYDEENEIINPHYSIDAKLILNPYFARIKVNPETINNYGLEIIVASWLTDIISGNININELKDYQDILIKSGLYKLIINGKLNYEIAA